MLFNTVKIRKKSHKRTISVDGRRYFVEFPDITFKMDFHKAPSKKYKTIYALSDFVLIYKQPIHLPNSEIIPKWFNYHMRFCMGDVKSTGIDRTTLAKKLVDSFFTTKFESTYQHFKHTTDYNQYCDNWQKHGLNFANLQVGKESEEWKDDAYWENYGDDDDDDDE